MALSKVFMEEMLHKYCPNWTVDPSIPMKHARKLITLLVSHLYFSDGPVKWKDARVPDYIRDPNNSSNGRPKPKEDELKEMLGRMLEEYQTRKMEPDSSDVVALQAESEANENASLGPTEVDTTGKYGDDDDKMLFPSFEDKISTLRHILMKFEGTKCYNAYLIWISRFVDKLDVSDRDDLNIQMAVKWIELALKVYLRKNECGYLEDMKNFVEHGKFEWKVKTNKKDEDYQFCSQEEASSSKFPATAKMYMNNQYPVSHLPYAVNLQNTNNSKEDTIGQQQPSNLANVLPVESISAVNAIVGNDTGYEEVVQSKDDGPLNQISEVEMLAENPNPCEGDEIFANKKCQDQIDSMKKFGFEENMLYDEDPCLGLYRDFNELRTDRLNSSNFPE